MTSELRAWIESVPFTFASTMAENPHHYIVERVHGGPEFDAFVQAIKEEGGKRLYRGWRYRMIVVGAYTYWLTWAGGAGRVINRKPTDEAGWDDDGEQLRLRPMSGKPRVLAKGVRNTLARLGARPRQEGRPAPRPRRGRDADAVRDRHNHLGGGVVEPDALVTCPYCVKALKAAAKAAKAGAAKQSE